ncbi:GNAT family N-acetyltransferase [Heyndrickxia vini]|uniref:GNAT family N-acetyltransferase n=1 Tax=Heyndrickxia vini TaxID=1476025 RepID=A0ABX7DXL5_9BACI|nr:GNAT family N-acetyltransferase [Heyndrickxia vini]QQZ07714.1 GNAT family N-acetyltransferase [Heyndrickxia vini]
MFRVEIRRPRIGDIEELNIFFSLVIKDTFAREGLSELVEDIEHEIAEKNAFLKSDLESNGENHYFLIALVKNKIVGTIAYGPSNELINRCTDGVYKNLIEIGTVFVHPHYQRKGIGAILLNSIFLTLQHKGIKEFCLDSGYKQAQKIWQKKFGDPNYLMQNFWGEGSDHMIWRRNLLETRIIFGV